MIEQFHFLRPLWLLALIVPLLLVWWSVRAADIMKRWEQMIAPHLLEHLIVAPQAKRAILPAISIAVALGIGTLALSGPTWTKETPPFVQDTSPLVIAIDLSETMNAIDVSPSRLERAKLKARDVVEKRGGRTAIIAYAGTAHIVLPFTEDQSLIQSYVDALDSSVMPVPGKDTAKAITTADDMLTADTSGSGTTLIITDGVEKSAFDAISASSNPLLVLAIGTEAGGPVKLPDGGFLTENGTRTRAKLDTNSLGELDGLRNVEIHYATNDETDITWAVQRIASSYRAKAAEDATRWRDMGWWLSLPFAALFLLSFRRGWVAKLGVALVLVIHLSPAPADAADFIDLWLTPDQQGRMAYQKGDYPTAASKFNDPMWQGIAYYREKKYQDAINSFAQVETADSWYNQGDALIQLAKYDDAIAAYKKALELNPHWADAKTNLQIAERLAEIAKKDDKEQAEDPNEPPDQVKFDDKGKKGKEGKIDISEQTSEIWMKNLLVTPHDLLARKFSLEANGAKQ